MKFSTEMKKEMGILCFVTGLLMLIPLFNAVGPESGPLSVSAFQVSLWGKYLTYAVLAMSLNLLWGPTRSFWTKAFAALPPQLKNTLYSQSYVSALSSAGAGVVELSIYF